MNSLNNRKEQKGLILTLEEFKQKKAELVKDLEHVNGGLEAAKKPQSCDDCRGLCGEAICY